MGSEGNKKSSVVTQVSIGGFWEATTAKELTDYLEEEVGLVWRCRLKTSWTPPGSYPNFEIDDTSNIPRVDDYKRVEPHAFVHFAVPESAARAMDAAGQSSLILDGQPLKASLGPKNPYTLNQRRRTTTPCKLTGISLEIGTLVSRDEFLVSWRAEGVDFLVDPFDNTCRFCFTKSTAFSLKDTAMHAVIKCDYKLELLVRDIRTVREYSRPLDCYVLILQLASSPRVWYRTADDDIYETVPVDLLDDDDPWIRTTDFTQTGAISRCLSYRVLISPRHEKKLTTTLDYLRQRRVHVERVRPPRIRNDPCFGESVSDHFFCIHHKEGISFEIMFLVNSVLHKGIFNQFQMTERFFDLLRNQPRDVNVASLKHLCTYKRPVFDAYKRLKLVQEWIQKNPKLLVSREQSEDISEIRRLVITPTRAYCLPPEVELSNRVLRKYKALAERFLRVTFMDESMQTMNSNVLSYFVAPIVKNLTSSSFSQKTCVFKRVKTILTDGFKLCGRKYSFLAFSANQLRDRSAWFFAEDGKTSVLDIKAWMGKFKDKNVAKCAARMGLCFSSTYATVDVMPHEVDEELPEIERNGYVFSDGIGTIAPDLAAEVMEKLKLDVHCTPCAYQIRYAGFKGVVALWPPSKGDGIRLALRPSMRKFFSKHTILEICSWTRFQPGFLNRQIITLLSVLGVPDEIFWEMQESMLCKLNRILDDTDVAFEVLTASCAEQGNTAAIMLSAGFKPKTEPHLRGMLSSVRIAQLWGLREKSRIFVTSGRWLMGCLDEAGILEQGQCFIQVSKPSIENCFSKHGSRFRETKTDLQVVKGYVAIAKNPCLHPGDVRILEAVDVPQLHHMYDCLIFPQKGERPHTNEASGSDLDGDLYFVAWDQKLIPPSRKSFPAMIYDAAEEMISLRPVNHQAIIDFFAKNMANEHLGTICNAHVVHADRSEYGAMDEECLLLAELAARAVDFPKTGKTVTMPFHLKPKLYPDFMGKEEYQTYKSSKILGRLYRRVKEVYDEDAEASSEESSGPSDIPYDTDLEISGFADFVPEAWDHKCSYDGQLIGLLGQYKVQKEEEIVTGHIWSMPKYTSKKQGELKERLKHSYNSLKKEFRKVFEETNSDHEELSEEETSFLYEKKASAWYHVTYHPKWVKKCLELQDPDESSSHAVMLSFAWIAADYLARIKIRSRGLRNKKDDSAKPVDSLAKYLSQRL